MVFTQSSISSIVVFITGGVRSRNVSLFSCLLLHMDPVSFTGTCGNRLTMSMLPSVFVLLKLAILILEKVSKCFTN